MSDMFRLIYLFRQDKDDLKKIHTHSLDLIEECGIRFHSDRALEILDGSGAIVDGSICKIPGNLIESALKKAPESFMLCARDAQHDLNLDSEHTFYSQDGCAAFTIDFESGVRRRSCKEDIKKNMDEVVAAYSDR